MNVNSRRGRQGAIEAPCGRTRSHELAAMYQFPLTFVSGSSEYLAPDGVIAFFHSVLKVCRVTNTAAGSLFLTQSV